ncbi:MAG: ComEC/Rec2 family competence protein, partial [Halieaceae bacterium]
SQSLFGRLFATHAYMCLAMIPIAGWWFGGASLVAAAANFLLVPLVTFLLVPLALLGAVLCLLTVPGFEAPWRWAADCIDALLQGGHDIAANYGQWFYLWLSPSPVQMLLALLSAALLVIPRYPLLRVIALVLIMPLALPVEREIPEVPVLTVFDAGQGTAVLFRSGANALLYDTGGGDSTGPNIASSVIVPMLRRLNVAELDTLVISHSDNDHSAGTAAIVNALPVTRYRYGGSSVVAGAGGLPCRAGESWEWPDKVRFHLLAPALEPALSSNDMSCVLMIELGGRRILLPGDIRATRERVLVDYWGDALDSDVLLTAHHGSQSSSGWAFLKAVQPGIALFSYGFGNPFGHPNGAVVGRAGQFADELGLTGHEGALQLRFLPSGEIELSRWRQQQWYYWM